MTQAVYLEKKEHTLYKFCLWTMVKHAKGRKIFKTGTAPVTQIGTYFSPKKFKLVQKRRGFVRNSK